MFRRIENRLLANMRMSVSPSSLESAGSGRPRADDRKILPPSSEGAVALSLQTAHALVACIHDVLAGKTYLAPAAAAKLAEGVTRVQVTPRELAALRLLADGKSNKEIASALGISERTVKSHLGHLFEKLGATSRTEAVKVATRRGLVRLD